MTSKISEPYPSTIVRRVTFEDGGVADILTVMVGDSKFEPKELFNEYRKELNDSSIERYMILVYTYDPYGQGQARYESAPEENFHLMVFNASAWKNADRKDLKDMLCYIATGETCDDPFLEELDARVKQTAEKLASENE